MPITSINEDNDSVVIHFRDYGIPDNRFNIVFRKTEIDRLQTVTKKQIQNWSNEDNSCVSFLSNKVPLKDGRVIIFKVKESYEKDSGIYNQQTLMPPFLLAD